MAGPNRNISWKKIVDVLAGVFIITPLASVIWGFIIIYSNNDGRMPLHPTLFGWLPAPVEVLLISIFPCIFGLAWLLFRYVDLLFIRYPFMKSWQFKCLVMFAPGALVILGRIVYRIFAA